MAYNKLYTELTFFSTQITNLLVARRTAEDQYIGIKWEWVRIWDGISLNYQLLQTSQFKLSSYFSAAVNRFTFKDFIDGDNIILEINSRPDAQWNVGLDASSTSGFSLYFFSKVGRIPMNDQNSKYTETYSL
jgi:iron complex outermembrane receptor protein